MGKLQEYAQNIAFILLWAAVWECLCLFILKYFPKNVVKAYIVVFIIGSVLVFVFSAHEEF